MAYLWLVSFPAGKFYGMFRDPRFPIHLKGMAYIKAGELAVWDV